MRIPQGTGEPKAAWAEVEAAASKDTARPSIMLPYLNIEDGEGYLDATDSCVLVRVPVELAEDDTPGPVPVEALKAARKNRYVAENQTVALNHAASVTTDDGATMTFPRPEDVSFPDVSALLNVARHEFSIVLNVDKLAQVGKALGAKECRLSFSIGEDDKPSKLKPVIVEPTRGFKDDGRIGLVMPVRDRS